MLKLSVGYQHNGIEPFSNIVKTYADNICEVYFPWITEPSGRSKMSLWEEDCENLESEFISEIQKIKAMGVKLDLLFNANCYGDDAMSVALSERVCSRIGCLEKYGIRPDVITTTSPAIAHIIKEKYGDIELKASVNMKIASVKGMEYVSHLFDSFCVAKECNRDVEKLKRMHDWAGKRGKKLTMLANSGCMRDCSGQIFHDNMVAHEDEISKKENIRFLPYMCWNFLKDKNNFPAVLQNTWVRPEDIHRYDGLVDCIKLATRAHHLPGMVIDAYARRRYAGNLLDLFEPGFGPAFAPYAIDSSKIPEDFWERTTACDKNCEKCDYCRNVLEKSIVIA